MDTKQKAMTTTLKGLADLVYVKVRFNKHKTLVTQVSDFRHSGEQELQEGAHKDK